ncbi:DUF998 domain-containing protein [Thermococcus alcaliphilus]|uniref:DUF998 domain-containing protein n=1 Tax=Thermococcus alcaliphilus TaxID=139207 RepID=UPI002090FA2C|nr:DUF998 domain-containing protein [Thermococcus alcaliphilus]MCO6040245.1 DUF998 domain-containing protein [Thermococcus alcaliphilus]
MKRWVRILGLSFPFLTFGGIFIAIYLNPWFSLTENALSDMGSIKNPIEYVFNSLLVFLGLLGLVFGVEMLKEKRVTVLFPLGMISLLLVGIFPEEYKPHSFFALSFYILLFADIFICGLRQRSKKKSALIWLLSSPLVFIMMLYLTRVFEGLAIPELVGALFINAWIVYLALEVEQ